MNNRKTRQVRIESWEEGKAFVPVWKGRRLVTGSQLPVFGVRGSETPFLSQTLRPVGFYVTYSCTLFREGKPQPAAYGAEIC